MIKQNETLESATINGKTLRVYDDCMGVLWLYGMEYGPTMLIRANSLEDAIGIAHDESPAIEVDDLPEAYGFYLMQACKWNEQNSTAKWYVLSDHDDHGEMVSAEVLVCTGDRRSIGCYDTKQEARDACMEYVNDNADDIYLIEGYVYQPNSTGTGIVSVGHHEWCHKLTDNDVQQYQIEAVIVSEDD